MEGVDNCGYDNELVWTSTQGGLQPQNNHGRLNSETALQNVTHVALDLGKLQLIRGVQVQGGYVRMCIWACTCICTFLSYV